jgi:uncharacterized membrane protein YhiD involved in acid resistance
VNVFNIDELVILGGSDIPKLWELLVRMGAATLLGACIAFRIWRVAMRFVSRPSLQSAQAQTLIAAAGAVMVVVIGDSPARAFGLVGLGSFIRFRSGISDPRDAAVMFVMIGIGMSCGLGLFSMAVGATLFICLILTLFDATRNRAEKPTLVTINAEDATYVRGEVQRIFPGVRIVEAASNAPELGKDSGKLVVELCLRQNMDAGVISQTLAREGVHGVRRVALEVEE